MCATALFCFAAVTLLVYISRALDCHLSSELWDGNTMDSINSCFSLTQNLSWLKRHPALIESRKHEASLIDWESERQPQTGPDGLKYIQCFRREVSICAIEMNVNQIRKFLIYGEMWSWKYKEEQMKARTIWLGKFNNRRRKPTRGL